MDANPTITIAQALFDFSGSGQGVDDMLEAIAHAQAEAVINALTSAGYTIIHRDENHGPTQERIAAWIEPQRNDIPATGSEFAAAIRSMEVRNE